MKKSPLIYVINFLQKKNYLLGSFLLLCQIQIVHTLDYFITINKE